MTRLQTSETRPLSARGQHWQLKPCEYQKIEALQQATKLPRLLAQLLDQRGVAADAAHEFLHPTFKASMPNPSAILNMDAAVELMGQAILQRQTIGIFGDYDVDGACATSLWINYLRALDVPCIFHIPDRVREGYGPNVDALKKLAADGAQLIILVDCGTTAVDVLQAAHADTHVPFVVIDHHVAAGTLPSTATIVNPNQPADESGLQYLCAAGVVWLVLAALNRYLRGQIFFTEARAEPDIKAALDLVALATICDVVPLVQLNRLYVKRGLAQWRQQPRLGLNIMSTLARVESAKVDVYQLGFVYGPRINAGGRLGIATRGVELLTTQDSGQAMRIAEQLEQWNAERKAQEQRALEQAIVEVERGQHCYGRWLMLPTDAHPGIIGIMAGRLKEQFQRPVAVATRVHDVWKGSVRSVNGVHVGQLILQAKEKGLLLHGGGHAMAAGFTLADEQWKPFAAFMQQSLDQLPEQPTAALIDVDAVVDLSAIHVKLVEEIEALGPFGAEQPHPQFLLSGVRLKSFSMLNGGHIRLMLESVDQSVRHSAMVFRADQNGLHDFIQRHQGQMISCLVQLKLDEYQGRRSASVIVSDMMVGAFNN